MAYPVKVRVSFKEKTTGKKYVTSQMVDFFETIEEAVEKLGKVQTVNKVNEQIRLERADILRGKLKAKVEGKTGSVSDAEEIDLSDDIA